MRISRRRSAVPRWRLAVLPLSTGLVAIAATACSSSSSPSPTTTPAASTSSAATATTPTSSDPATASAPAGNLAAITVQASDLPSGWKPTAYQPDPTDNARQAQLAACVGVPNTRPHRTGTAHSPDYNQGDATISSDASSYASEADVVNDVAMVKSPKIDACFKKVVQEQVATSLPQGTTVKDLSVHVTPGAGSGPNNVVATVAGRVTVTVSGQTATVYLDSALIRGPRIEAEADFENIGAPVPSTLQATVIAAVAGRAAAA